MKDDSHADLHFYHATEAIIPDHFPKIYESDRGETIVFLGAIVKDRMDMSLSSSPWWAKGKHSFDEDVKKKIIGYYRISNGFIYEAAFIDETTFSSFDVMEKNEFVCLPDATSTYFGICTCDSREENTAETREIFGLTYEELSKVLDAYGHIFGLGDDYFSFPKVTRSGQRDNSCDLSNAWIPKGFPYIAFDKSDCPFSHVSLGAFYEHIRLLLLHTTQSIIWKLMVEYGVQKTVLERIASISSYGITPVRYGEFSEFKK